MAELSYHTENKLIACVLPKGKARPLQEALAKEKGIQSGNFHHGRGVGRDSHIRDRGIGEQQERDIFEVVVEPEKADEIFEYIFMQAEMYEPHGGMIYMLACPRSTLMTLPDIPEPE